MLFYQVGELFQTYAVGKSRQSITALMDIRPDYANIERGGELVQVDPDEVSVGDTIVIKGRGAGAPGRRGAGGQVHTGHRRPHRRGPPREAEPGDDVISGCVNLSGLLKVRVTKALRSPPWPRSWT